MSCRCSAVSTMSSRSNAPSALATGPTSCGSRTTALSKADAFALCLQPHVCVRHADMWHPQQPQNRIGGLTPVPMAAPLKRVTGTREPPMSSLQASSAARQSDNRTRSARSCALLAYCKVVHSLEHPWCAQLDLHHLFGGLGIARVHVAHGEILRMKHHALSAEHHAQICAP